MREKVKQCHARVFLWKSNLILGVPALQRTLLLIDLHKPIAAIGGFPMGVPFSNPA